MIKKKLNELSQHEKQCVQNQNADFYMAALNSLENSGVAQEKKGN